MSDFEPIINQSRYNDEALHVRLLRLKENIDQAAPEFAEAMENFIRRLELAQAGNSVPQIGEAMPNFLLPDENGALISLEALLGAGPVIVTFHRGHWCPYCRLSVETLARTQTQLRPAQVVAITGDRPRYSKLLKAEAKAGFPMLTDLELGYTLSLNLAVWVDDKSAEFIAAAGYNIPEYQGSAGWILPIPAAFAVSQDGIIRGRHVDPDYRKRIDMDALIAMTDLVT